MVPKKIEDLDSGSENYFSDSPVESDAGDFQIDHEDDPSTTANLAMFTKDADELELERLVLGNSAGFRRMLFDDLEAAATTGDMQLATTDDHGVKDLEDDDLFDFEFAPTGEKKLTGAAAGESVQPAWEDSDDERMTISLTSATRLRKFRVAGEDDTVNGSVYTERLRQSFLQLNPMPKWAQFGQSQASKRRRRPLAGAGSSSDSDAEDEEYGTMPIDKFLRDIGQLGAIGTSKRRKLRPEVIDIQRSRDIPDIHRAAVTSLQFHPKFPILLSSSPSSILFLHHIDPQAHPVPNPRLTSVQARQVDVRHSEFRYPAGDKVVFAGRRKYYHSWDLESGVVQKTTRVYGHKEEHRTMEVFKLSPCGRYMGIVGSTRKGGGVINIVDTTTSNWLTAARLDSRHGIADFAWWSTGEGMTILGRDGQLGEYSVVDKRFIGLWRDEGNTGGTVVALGGHGGPAELGEDTWVAVGSNAGICNIYNRGDQFSFSEEGEVIVKGRPTPTKVFEQLVTSITAITFSPDGQLMAFASREKRDSLRLVHLPSCTVYRNWPTAETPLGRISAVAFGVDSKVVAVGNDNGKIRTWEVRS